MRTSRSASLLESRLRGIARWALCFLAKGPVILLVSLHVALGTELPTNSPVALAKPATTDLEFLHGLTRDVVQAARVPPGMKVGGSPTNTCGFTLIMPGGWGGYPAFWVRDFAMSLESGFITSAEMLNHLRLIARCQNGPVARRLQHGLVIPAFAVPDHINFDGRPVFYPGTYSSGEEQGNGAYGMLPPIDDHFEFVHIGYCLYRATGKADFLQEEVAGITLMERLMAAFGSPHVEAATGLVTTDATQRAVGFGFCDAVCLTGKLLFPSLLRYRAAGELAELCEATQHRNQTREYRKIQHQIRTYLPKAFGESQRLGGWLLAATEVGRQPDVWGTCYAIYLRALRGTAAQRAVDTLAEAVRNQTILFEGAVRHVPTNLDSSPTSAWEKTAGVAINTYQNGAYWHTPTGWLFAALQRSHPQLAANVVSDYIQHLRRNDFRLGSGHQAPWECFGPNHYAQNGVYMTSVALPWSIIAETGR